MKLFRYTFEAFTAPCEVTIRHEKEAVAATVAAAILREAKRLEIKYSYFRPDSVVGAINRRETSCFVLDEESAALIAQASVLAEETGYAFDVAVGTFKEAWRRGEPIDALKHAAGDGAFWLKGRSLCFAHSLTRLDLGGLVKERALDQAAHICKRHGVRHALLNFGGDLFALGEKNRSEPWRSAIVHPLTRKPYWAVCLREGALTTSGHYERSTQVGDRQVSHIITPQGGAVWLSATVADASAVRAGAFSTALLACPDVTIPVKMSAFLVGPDAQTLPLGGWADDYACGEASSR